MGDRRRLAHVLTVAALTATSLGVVSSTVPSASADDGYQSLPLHDVGDLAVDTVHGREFVSGDWRDDKVVVADADGDLIGAVGQLPDLSELLLDEDHSLLYAALPESHQIVAVDTGTLGVVRRYSLAGNLCPQHLALAAGSVWFSSSCRNDPGAATALGVLTPGTGQADVEAVPEWTGPLVLAGSPAYPDRLVLSGEQEGVEHVQLRRLTVGTTPASAVLEDRVGGASRTTNNDGRSVFGSTGDRIDGSFRRVLYSFADLSTTPVDGVDPGSEPLAVRPDGLVASAAGNVDEPAIRFWDATSHAIQTQSLGHSSPEYAANLDHAHLAFGSQDLYAVVTADASDDDASDFPVSLPALRVLHPLTTRHATLTVTTDKAVYEYGDRPLVLAHLSGGPVDREVSFSDSVQANDLVRGGGPFAGGPVDERGTAVARQLVGQTITVTVVHPPDVVGDPSSGATVSVRLPVRAKIGSTLDNSVPGPKGVDRVDVRDRPLYLTSVASAPNACVHVEVQVRRSAAWQRTRALTCTRLDRAGQARLRLGRHPVGTRLRVRTIWPGGSRFVHTASAWTPFRVVRLRGGDPDLP